MYPPDPEQSQHYTEHGYVVLPSLIDRACATALAADVVAVLATSNQPDSYLAQTSE